MAQSKKYDSEFQISPTYFCDTIPLEVKEDGVFFPIQLEGRTLRFKLDTSKAQATLYTDSKIENWEEVGNIVSQDSDERVDTTKIVMIPSIRIGSITIDGYIAALEPRPTNGTKHEGCIGFDFINKGIAIKIDKQKGWLIISNERKTFEKEKGYALHYDLKWFVPHITISPFIRHTDKALLDLTFPSLYVLNKTSFDKHAYKSKNVMSQVEGFAQGYLSNQTNSKREKQQVAFMQLERLKWDQFSFQVVRTMTTIGSSRIGFKVLDHGALIINPFRKEVILQPYTTETYTIINNKLLGLAFVPASHGVVVGLIFEKSEAYKKGIRQGDILLKINEIPVNNFQDILKNPMLENNKYQLTLRNKDGKEKIIEIER